MFHNYYNVTGKIVWSRQRNLSSCFEWVWSSSFTQAYIFSFTFFLDSEEVKHQVCGPYGASVKEQGPLGFTLDYGTQRACLKAKVQQAKQDKVTGPTVPFGPLESPRLWFCFIQSPCYNGLQLRVAAKIRRG